MSALSIEEAIQLRLDRTLVFTNGVFDILHVGHLKLLEHARSLGDILIVGINSDASVRRLGKGPDRPINNQENRARLVSALRCVDGVVVFDEDTPQRVIELLRPEIHIKGGDYVAEELPEASAVRSYGGRIEIVPLIHDQSTTNILKKLQAE